MAGTRPDAVAPCPVGQAVAGLLSRVLPEAPRVHLEPGLDADASSGSSPCWIIAFSGGLDSTVLLDACARALGAHQLIAAHVHHGLQPAADAWVEHCRRQSASRGVHFECLELGPAEPLGQGVESWARRERYRALWALAARVNASAVLTAHHADDLAETLLMRLARGTGLDGLAGALPERAERPQGRALLRPLLRLTRDDLMAYARRHALDWIDDPMNRDSAYRRVAFRERVLPVLSEAAPGFVRQLARAQDLLAQAARELDDLARADFERARIDTATDEPQAIDRRVAALLSPFRQAQLYRFWWRQLEGGAGGQIPSEAQSAEWCAQMIGSRASQAIMHRGPWCFVRYRDRIEAWASTMGAGDAAGSALAVAEPPLSCEFEWQGETEIVLPGWAARLRFAALHDPASLPAVAGRLVLSAPWRVDADGQAIGVRVSSGCSETRFRRRAAGPSRSLRKLWQEVGVAPVLRPWLPQLELGGQPVFVAGLGAVHPASSDGRAVSSAETPRKLSGPSSQERWVVVGFEPLADRDPRLRFCRPIAI